DERGRAFKIGEHDELVDQDAGSVTNRFLRLYGTVGLDVDDQLVEVRALFDTCRFDLVADAAHRTVRSVEQYAANSTARSEIHLVAATRTRRRRHITAAVLDLDLQIELAACGQMRNDMIGIDDLDVVHGLDVARGDYALALFLEAERHFLAV